MTKLEIIQKKIKELPPNALVEIEKYIDLISNNLRKKKRKFLKQDWAGCLKGDKNKYTSVELQHLISKQWGKVN